MPLEHSSSQAAFKKNVSTLMGEVGKSPHVDSPSQALAIAYATKRRNRAIGGMNPMANFAERESARGLMHQGPIRSIVPGRTDHIAMNVGGGSYVIPSQAVSHLGQNNTEAGHAVLNSMFGGGGPYGAGAPGITHGAGAPRAPKLSALAAGGVSDQGGARGNNGGAIPIMAAGGEYVLSPEQVRRVSLVHGGGGDLRFGHAVLDSWIKSLQKKHAKTIAKLPPPAKK